MYCVVYEFKVKDGKGVEFEKAWSDFTKAIYRVRGSLGSRLHKTEDPSFYVAYAQWPSQDVFENDSGHDYAPEELKAQGSLKEVTEDIRRVYHLEVIVDLLKGNEAANESKSSF